MKILILITVVLLTTPSFQTGESLQLTEHPDFDTYEDFLTEYYNKATTNDEIKLVQSYFPKFDTSLPAEKYTEFLAEYLNNNIKDIQAHEEVAKEHKDHHEVLAKAYMQEANRDENSHLELHDVYADIMEGEFLFYLNTVEVKEPHEIDEEKRIKSDLEKEVDDEVEKIVAKRKGGDVDVDHIDL